MENLKNKVNKVHIDKLDTLAVSSAPNSDFLPLRQTSRSRLRRPPDHFLHGRAARRLTMPRTLAARLPFSRLTKGSAPALLIVPFIIDDGSSITFA